MVDFDKFEKNVKNKYGNQEFPFDEQNWEKAAKMIDASRKGKNRGGIIFLSAVALLCTTGLVYYFGFSENSKALDKNNIASNEIVNNNTAALNENNNATAANNTSAESNQNNTPANEVNTINSDAGRSEINPNTATPNNKAGSEKTIVANTTNSNHQTENNVAHNHKQTADNVGHTESKANTTTAASEPKIAETKPVSSKKPAQVKSNTQTTTPSVLGTNNVAQTTAKPVAPSVTSGTSGSTEKLSDVSNTNETVTKTNVITSDTIIPVVTATVKPGENSITDSVTPIRKSKADSLAAMLPKGDGVSYATNVKEKHNPKNYLFMEAGTTYLLGWNSNGSTEAGGFNLLAGINFQHYFSNTISAQIGIQYNTINNLTNTTHTISTVKYDLGMEQDVTSIKYQKLLYLVAPIKFVFNAGDKNYIGIGCNLGYLLNSESKKEKYKTNSSDPNANKKDLTSTKELGYVEGFNPYDIQLSASYRRRIYKGLSANAEFIYGLTDTKNNTFFNSKSFDRNIGFKLSLCFDLFKK